MTPANLTPNQPCRVIGCAGPWIYVGPSRSKVVPCVRVSRDGRVYTMPADLVRAVAA